MPRNKNYVDEMDYSGNDFDRSFSGNSYKEDYEDDYEDDYDYDSDLESDELSKLATELIKKAEEDKAKEVSNKKAKTGSDDYDDDDDMDSMDEDDMNDFTTSEIATSDEGETVLIISSFISILGNVTDEVYTAFMYKVCNKMCKYSNVKVLDFTNVTVENYDKLKERIENENPSLTCCRTVLTSTVGFDNKQIISMQEIISYEQLNPLDRIDEICLFIKEKVNDSDFVLKYDLSQDLDNPSYITLAACIALTFPGKVTLDTTNIGVAVKYNKAISSLMLPYTEDPLKTIEVIRNYYKENFRKNQLVIICEDISILSMMTTGYAALIDNVGKDMITVRKVPTAAILNKRYVKNTKFLTTSIRYSDINILKSLILPIELAEEMPEVITALRDKSFEKEVGPDFLSNRATIQPDITHKNIEKTYYALSNSITASDRKMLQSIKDRAPLKSDLA